MHIHAQPDVIVVGSDSALLASFDHDPDLDVAIIASVLPARLPLLKRSLVTWRTAMQASGFNVTVCLALEDIDSVPDNPTPIAEPGTWDWDTLKVIARHGCSGSHIWGYNHWLDNVEAETYLFTHPDLLFTADTIKVAHQAAKPDVFVAFKTFWIPEGMTNNLEWFHWRTPEVLEQEPELYECDKREHGEFYANVNVRSIQTWESTTTWAMNRKTLFGLQPFPDFGCQGPDDPFFAGARQRLGIENHTVQDPILFHQWHPNSWHGTSEEALASKELRRRFGS